MAANIVESCRRELMRSLVGAFSTVIDTRVPSASELLSNLESTPHSKYYRDCYVCRRTLLDLQAKADTASKADVQANEQIQRLLGETCQPGCESTLNDVSSAAPGFNTSTSSVVTTEDDAVLNRLINAAIRSLDKLNTLDALSAVHKEAMLQTQLISQTLLDLRHRNLPRFQFIADVYGSTYPADGWETDGETLPWYTDQFVWNEALGLQLDRDSQNDESLPLSITALSNVISDLGSRIETQARFAAA